jgi:hypothetical protein
MIVSAAPFAVIQVEYAKQTPPNSHKKQSHPMGKPLNLAEPVCRGPCPGFIVHVLSVKKAASRHCA